jgi:hypothetical protein
MRYKDLSIDKLDQLENRLVGLQSMITYPQTTIIEVRDLIDELKARIHEIRSLINADQQD